MIEDKNDPISVKSRACILLKFSGAPIFWSLKLQIEIDLSTLEATYTALKEYRNWY